MKSDKSSFKKVVKNVTKSIRERSAKVAEKLKTKEASSLEPVSAKAKTPPAPETALPKKASTKAPAASAEGAKPPVVAKPKKQAAGKKPALQVPAILLEGDSPSTSTPAGPGQRYALGPVPPPAHSGGGGESSAELPEAYGTQRLLLTARDPRWLYARWDLTHEQQRKYNALSVDRHLVLRVYINVIQGDPFSQIHVHPESTHWFIPVDRGATKYLAQLGYYQPNGKWATVSTSGATLTPPDAMSEDVSAQFATIPIDIPFAQLMALARQAVHENIPLAEVLQQLRASGYAGQFPQESPAPGKWSPEQERALASIITIDKVRRVWMGSLEITELIRRQLQQEISSMAAG
jgi:hypothetical protein